MLLWLSKKKSVLLNECNRMLELECLLKSRGSNVLRKQKKDKTLYRLVLQL